MSERRTLETDVLFYARTLRMMQRAGLANMDDVERLATATDALIAYDEAQADAQEAVRL